MERELKQLARAELVEILSAQQKENEALKAENAKLRALLDERELHISTAGSIAEAALRSAPPAAAGIRAPARATGSPTAPTSMVMSRGSATATVAPLPASADAVSS